MTVHALPGWQTTNVEEAAFEIEADQARQRAARHIQARRWVHECVAEAEQRYQRMYDEVRRDYDIGIIGIEARSRKKHSRSIWIASAVRERLLRQLDRETPYREELR